MAVTVEDLREEVGATTADDALLTRCLTVAVELLTKYIVDNIEVEADRPGEELTDEATLATGAQLFDQSKAPNGFLNQQYEGVDGTESIPVRIGTDPLRRARGLLDLYVIPAIG